MRIYEARQKAREELGEEADLLLRLCLDLTLTDYLKQLQRELRKEEQERIFSAIKRRKAGEPLQYAAGACWFYGIRFRIDSRALIPRPETELLVETALCLCEHKDFVLAADLGTGSGNIALSLAKKRRPHSMKIYATDLSEEALSLAKENRELIEPSNEVLFFKGDFFDALLPELKGALDLVLSNPPYVAEEELNSLPSEVKDHEPRLALYGGRDGLEAVDQILREARSWLKPGAFLLVEIGAEQGRRAFEMAKGYGYREVFLKKDPAGRDRLLICKL